jgi:hypothetical protein
MIQIDYLSLLKDIGLKDKLLNSVQGKFNLTDQQLENIYQDRVEYHGKKMDAYIQSYLTQYNNLKKDNDSLEIDKKLDEMVAQVITTSSEINAKVK